MSRVSRRLRAMALAVLGLGLVALAAPAAWRGWWRVRTDNAVRRGIARAAELGCFQCHGPSGTAGIPDPGLPEETVPAWGGMVWMMFVEDEAEVREFILDGVSRRRAASVSAKAQRAQAAIQMPAYRDRLRGSDLDDLTAAFLVASGMRRPPAGTAARRGDAVVRRWRCDACHGPGGSGGLPNPGSFAGFIPGYYGPAFRDLVRSREEFGEWVRRGTISRLEGSPLGAWFLRRQKVRMPAYPGLTEAEVDDLWAYAGWLEATEGGLVPVPAPGTGEGPE